MGKQYSWENKSRAKKSSSHPITGRRRRCTVTYVSSSGDCDLISTMPDPILHRILGLLKAKEAVQTCVLSKRWQHLWTSLPSLHFDSIEFTWLEEPEYDSEDEESSNKWVPEYVQEHDFAKFARFVNSVMLRRKPLPLDMFSLSFGALNSNDMLLRNWVIYAVHRNPRVVRLAFLQFSSTFVNTVLHCLYTCTSLEELYLHHCERVSSKYTCRAVVNLPNLKRLSIYNDFLTKNELKDLLSGCPILQYLWLEQCQLQKDEITNESLQHLTIVNSKITFISAPNLLTFHFISSEPTATLNMLSLTYARIELKNPMIQGWKGLASFFSGLVNVEILELQVPFKLKVKKEEILLPELPIFQKMHDFSVGGFCKCFGFCLVTWILGKAPNLKKLTFLQLRECSCFCRGEEVNTSEWTDGSFSAAISLCKSLEFVEVKYSMSDHTVRRLVDAVFKGTKELQNVNILLSKQ
ncbi:hypothetical protein LUZ61_016460 [Rhynchospora tenuis]|uniref:F-box domain-containing protein n=1 Tax=Rhynchospora tenuis TaxID=198213 RepID=A0AAD5Z5M3_9POAL|nr:hypothetical protein LUZ61_016460 [Rhynchospora tenuis]